jgi:spore coat protein U-like protein
MRSLRKGLVALAGTLACAVACSALHAAGVECSFSAAALAFPAYETFGSSPTDGIGTVAVNCSNLDGSASNGVNVALRLGASANGGVTDRKMASNGNGDTLRYGIYSDAGRSQNWGDDGNAPTQSTGALASHQSKNMNFTLYGRIPPLQNPRAGHYADSVFVTVSP